MANVTETSNFDTGVYQLEITDPLEGGSGGILNKAIKNLANRTVWLNDELTANKWLSRDIKEVDCDLAYIAANFDETGLGMNERLGWAICNGNNGTKYRGGIVSVGHGGAYSVGQTGGSKDAVVVAHTHTYSQYVQSGSNDGSGGEAAGFFQTGTTSSAGVSGTDKNMQPYLVTLFIMKL